MSNLLNDTLKDHLVKETLAPSYQELSSDSLSIENLSVEDLSWWLEITSNIKQCKPEESTKLISI